MPVKTFQDIIAWQKSHELVLFVYKITKDFPKDERFRLVDQLCRSVASVAANIVEGFKRKTTADSVRFYNISLASLEETKYHLLLSRDLGYIDNGMYECVLHMSNECGRLIHAWSEVQR